MQPVLDGEVDVAHGSRVLGHAEANHFAREMGIIFFNRLVSFITRTKVTDCSNGYRAVRASVLPTLVLRQEQFHTSEFMIEAIKRGVPAKEVADHRRLPPARALEEARRDPLRDRLHERDHADLAALTAAQGGQHALGGVLERLAERDLEVRATPAPRRAAPTPVKSGISPARALA